MPQELSEDDVLIRLDDFVVNVNGTPEVEVDVDGRQSTVDPRPVYDFERDILDDVIGSTVSGGNSGAAIPVKGRWIHGWLEENTDEYINGLWRNYQFFLKYLQAETSKIKNMSAFNKAPGTYESMYRYILVLEDLDLIDRYRREEVPESEYDMNVPEEFRTRTFVRLQASYEDNQQLWDNPIGVKYGDVDAEEAQQFEEFVQENEIDASDSDSGDTMSELDEDEIQEMLDAVESSETEDEPIGEDEPEPEIDDDVSEITDIGNLEALFDYIKSIEDEVIEEAILEDPLNRDIDKSIISFERLAVLGKWANGEATIKEDRIFLFLSIKQNSETSSGLNKPTFLQTAVARITQKKLNEENPFDDIIPSYKVKTAYNSNFRSEINRVIKTAQDLGPQYYSYRDEEYIDTSE
jgi:hypothetical protein